MKQFGQILTVIAAVGGLSACGGGGGGGGNGGGEEPDNRPALSIADATLVEGDSGSANLEFSVSLSAALGEPVTFSYATSDDTASAGDDYDASSGTARIDAGQTSLTLSVPVHGDTTVETDEGLTLTLSNASSNARLADGAASGTIENDDRPQLSIADVTQDEGDADAALQFSVTLDQPAAAPVSFSYATQDGSATVADSDYTAASGNVTIPAGQSAATIDVTVHGDAIAEPDEDFSIVLSQISGADVVRGTATATLREDDRARLSIADGSLAEGDAGSANMDFTISVDPPAAVAIDVTATSADGSATQADGDYSASSSTLTIPAGSASATFSVPITGDTRIEGDEQFSVSLSNASAQGYISNASAIGVIADDDLAAISVDDPSVIEGDSGTQTLTFTVSIAPAAEVPISVDYATGAAQSGPSATADYDYAAASGSLTFAAGQTSASVAVSVNGDFAVEPDDVVDLILSNWSAQVDPVDTRGSGTILDDDISLLNDTGITVCATNTQTGLDCNSAAAGTDAFAGQDAEFGIDTQSTDDSDGLAGLSFTKLDTSGNELPLAASDWACVRDNVTGLVWEVKSSDAGLHDAGHSYTWYDDDPTSNGTNIDDGSGTENAGTCAGGSGCDTKRFAADVNSEQLCGFSDWRVPRIDELRLLVSHGAGTGYQLDGNFFPNASGSEVLWSDTPQSQNPVTSAWAVDIGGGFQRSLLKSSPQPLRLVRGEILRSGTTPANAGLTQTCRASIVPTAPTDRFTVNGDGTVSDADTGLMWKQCPEGLSGASCDTPIGGGLIDYAALAHTWQEALAQVGSVNASADAAVNPGNHGDWRLPNVKELATIVERACHNPALNLAVFPGDYKDRTVDTQDGRTDIRFWSSSPSITQGNKAWAVQIYAGGDSRVVKTESQVPLVIDVSDGYSYWVRLVRDAN
jgi:hypothetical protein